MEADVKGVDDGNGVKEHKKRTVGIKTATKLLGIEPFLFSQLETWLFLPHWAEARGMAGIPSYQEWLFSDRNVEIFYIPLHRSFLQHVVGSGFSQFQSFSCGIAEEQEILQHAQTVEELSTS